MTDPTGVASYESKTEAVESNEDFVRIWCDQVDRSAEEEKDWREASEEAVKVYRGDKDSRNTDFNIFHANIETLVPALYNSTPVPDIRRRFLDADPIGKQTAQLLERALSHSIDTYDFDTTMLTATKDMAIVDRGQARVRYKPYFKGKMPDPDNPELEIDKLSYQEVCCEYVPWRDYRRGPGRTREEMPWEAFKLYLNKEELAKLIEGSNIDIKEVPFNYTASSSSDSEPKKQDNPKEDVFKRALVWEIWDKDNREVIFICPDYKKDALKREQDPLELEGFFCTPRPMQALSVPGDMTPITPYSIYKKLVDELNEITRRIRTLVKACRARGGYASSTPDVKAISEADEAELIPIQGVEVFAQAGGLEKAIVWWPIEAMANALKVLYEQREVIKQTIYEVTGIADILRGATDARETLGAQQLKAQWGSLRIQRMQSEVARFARDLFRLKAEIIANKFTAQNLTLMTGIQVTPEIQALLRDDVTRQYRVDIESDSTIRADMMRNQEAMTNFLSGTAQYMAAVGPAVQEGYMPADAAVAVFTAFARQFKLGKQAEDALDKLQEGAAQAAQQTKPPSPEELKLTLEREKMALEKEKMQVEIQMKQAELQLKQAEMEQDLAIQQQELQMKMQLEAQKAELDAAIKEKESQIKQQTMMEEHGLKMKLKQDEAALAMQTQQQKGVIDIEMQRAKGTTELRQKQESFKQDSAHKEKLSAQELKLREKESEARSKDERRRADDKAKKDSDREDKERKEKPKSRKRKVTTSKGETYTIEEAA